MDSERKRLHQTLSWSSGFGFGCSNCGPSMKEPCSHWKVFNATERELNAVLAEKLREAREALESCVEAIIDDCRNVHVAKRAYTQARAALALIPTEAAAPQPEQFAGDDDIKTDILTFAEAAAKEAQPPTVDSPDAPPCICENMGDGTRKLTLDCPRHKPMTPAENSPDAPRTWTVEEIHAVIDKVNDECEGWVRPSEYKKAFAKLPMTPAGGLRKKIAALERECNELRARMARLSERWTKRAEHLRSLNDWLANRGEIECLESCARQIDTILAGVEPGEGETR